MTPDPSPSTDKSQATSSLREQRSELTRELLKSHYANDIDTQQRAVRVGTQWFYWVAALSLINSVITLFEGGVTFLAGLAVSQIADAIAMSLGALGPYFAIGAELVVAVILCGIGYLASHGSRAALLTGMILYALDGVIFALFSEWAPALFHVFVLYQIWRGWVASQRVDQLRSESSALAEGQPTRRGPIA